MKGRLAPSLLLIADEEKLVYEVIVPKSAKVSFNVLNGTATDATIQVWIGSNTLPQEAEKIEHLVLTANGSILERTDIGMSRGEKLFIKSSIAGTTVRIWGEEEM